MISNRHECISRKSSLEHLKKRITKMISTFEMTQGYFCIYGVGIRLREILSHQIWKDIANCTSVKIWGLLHLNLISLRNRFTDTIELGVVYELSHRVRLGMFKVKFSYILPLCPLELSAKLGRQRDCRHQFNE